jgi:hypothetical protein
MASRVVVAGKKASRATSLFSFFLSKRLLLRMLTNIPAIIANTLQHVTTKQ